MTVEEVFSTISARAIKGMMVHEQFANYYNFLGLEGYKECHEYHYIEETLSYRDICEYYISHYNKLIPEVQIENPKVIPASWYNHVRQDVDTNTKRNSVKTGLTTWKDWEMNTKKLYEQMFKELMTLNEIAAACKIKELVMNVDKELEKVEGYLLNKEAVGYDIGHIISEQSKKHEEYRNKIEGKM